ncbi:hypothetical protein [Actinoplanes sp. NPDC051494]|uniref:hypothetical protein n=1 Tax=Actinoplanes sp. NPDC051494 TaxID=3363907 RepID=UPI0037B2A3EF
MIEPIHPQPDPQQQPLIRTTPACRSRKPLWIALAATVGVLTVVGATVGVTLAATSDPPATPAAQPLSAWDREQQAAAQPNVATDEGTVVVDEPTSGPTLNPALVELTYKVTDKQCFGSAGCNVSIKLQLGYGGPDLASDETWEVTYQVKGDDDGPIIGTFEVTGQEYTVPTESLSTASKNTKISVEVTDVDKQGI